MHVWLCGYELIQIFKVQYDEFNEAKCDFYYTALVFLKKKEEKIGSRIVNRFSISDLESQHNYG